MINTLRATVLSVLLLLISATSVSALPNYLEDFRRDPFRNPAVDGCNTCHMSPQGGDARNPFGLAFAANMFRITPMLRAQFPDRFVYPRSQDAGTTIHFADPENRQVVVESGSTRTVIDVAAKTVNGTAASAAATPPAAAPSDALAVEPQSEVPVDRFAREGAFFGMNVVNLPNGKPQEGLGSVDFIIAHRFQRHVCLDDCTGPEAGAGELYGLDGPAFIFFNVRAGLTSRLSASVGRSNRGPRTIEFGTSYQVSRQSDTVPITFAMRAGVEGRNNFRERYSPYIQPVVTRTFADRVSVTLAPTFAFNTRNENTFLPPELVFGDEHNHTIALGVGLGVRFHPTASVIGEYIPRLWGFKGEVKDRPGVSIAIEKSTFRHTFQFILTRQDPMTTSQYAVQGTDTFRLGFNIFRRIR